MTKRFPLFLSVLLFPFSLAFAQTAGEEGDNDAENEPAQTLYKYDLEAGEASVPTMVEAGAEYKISFSVANVGERDVKSYSVELYTDDVLVDALEGSAVNAGEETQVIFRCVMPVTAEEMLRHKLVIIFFKDENLDNNCTEEFHVGVVHSELPAVTGLKAQCGYGCVSLEWVVPGCEEASGDIHGCHENLPLWAIVLGYNVYRDGVRINDNLVETASFADEFAANFQTYTYNVTAIYEEGESRPSEGVEIYYIDAGVDDMEISRPMIRSEAGCVVITNCHAPVQVWHIDGRLAVEVGSVQAGDELRIELPAGLYLLRHSDDTVKILVR